MIERQIISESQRIAVGEKQNTYCSANSEMRRIVNASLSVQIISSQCNKYLEEAG